MKMRIGNMLKIIVVSLIVLNLFAIAYALDEDEEKFRQAEEIIKAKISCSELTEGQLEALGDYYMEQMHPGELHEIMDERMGGEGSESLKQVHINMGKTFYCGESRTMSSGMMNMMMNRNGMMGYYGSYSQQYSIFWFIFSIIVIIALILLILWLVKQLNNGRRR